MAVGKLQNLETLRLDNSSVSTLPCKTLPSGLTCLDLTGCRQLSPSELEHISALRRLSILSLTDCDVWDSVLCSLDRLKNLMSLALNGSQRVTGYGLAAVGSCTRLRTLEAAGCVNLTDDGLESLTRLSNLRTLNLGSWRGPLSPAGGASSAERCCCRLTDRSLAALGSLTSLESVDLAGNANFTDEGVARLGALTGLTRLSLGGCALVTNRGLRQMLPPLSSLRELQLSCLGGITDQGISAAAGLRALRCVVLNGCGSLSDGAVRELLRLPALEEAHLLGCHRLSLAAVERLRAGGVDAVWYAHPNEWVDYR